MRSSIRFRPFTGAATRPVRPRRREYGAALVIALVLLTVLAVLGASGMSTSTLELTLAGNARLRQLAFEAAEAGIDLALARHGTVTTGSIEPVLQRFEDGAEVRASAALAAATPVPHTAFSMGTASDTFEALHFEVTSVGEAPRGASVTLRQGFYIIVPAGGD